MCYILDMQRFLNDKQKEEINQALEDMGAEYGIPLKRFDNIMLGSDPLTIIYNHEVIGLCKTEVTTEYFENGDVDALRDCMRNAVKQLKEQLDNPQPSGSSH